MLGCLTLAAAGGVLAVRLARSRHRRSLHPAGRSFGGHLETFGLGDGFGAELLDRAARYRVTVRLSKGIGTRGGRADVRGVAVRVHRSDRDLDLLLSTAGRGRVTRHLPAVRRSFDVPYSSITAYRTAAHTKVYLTAGPDPDGPALGRALPQLAAGDRLLLGIRHAGAERAFGRVTLGAEKSPATDAALAFDAIRNSSPDLHPTGFVHGLRAGAYRLSQLWRGARPPAPNPVAVARTSAHG
jgi:hypothetical protein